MTKQLKYEFLNRRNFYLISLLIVLAQIVTYFLFGVLKVSGPNASMPLGITISALLFICSGVIILIAMLRSFAKDFQDDSRYLTFTVPRKSSTFLTSRFISTTADVVMLFVIVLWPFLVTTFHFTGIEKDISGAFAQMSQFLKGIDSFAKFKVFEVFVICIISYLQLIFVAYFSTIVSKCFNFKKFAGSVVTLLIFFLTYYVISFIDIVPLMVFGNRVTVAAKFFIAVNGDLSNIPAMMAYFLVKALELAAIYVVSVRLLDKKINV